jgi:hypothetical protein
MKPFARVLTVVACLAACSVASAQAVVYETYSPVVTTAPVVAQSPVVVDAWRPVVTNYGYNPPVSSPNFTAYTSNYGNYGAAISYYAPSTTYAPVTTYSPVVTEAVTAYSPVVTTSYSPVVTTAYSPVVTYSPVVRSYYVARPVYVPGQPVRNFFRGMAW